jgi:predicted ATPase
MVSGDHHRVRAQERDTDDGALTSGGVGSLAELVAGLRTSRGLSQEQLGVAAGVSVRAIGDLERGATRRPQGRTIDALAAALGLTGEERVALSEAARRQPLRARPPADRPAARPAPRGDVVDVTRLLRDARARMVTITGPPGVGKSVLARLAARQVADAFQHTTVVDLSALDDPADAGGVIAQRLGAPDGTFAAITSRIGSAVWLLVLDGVDGVAGLAPELAELLARCPRLSLLVTGRSPLRLRAEQRWPLAGLPAAGDAPAAVGGAVDLLVELVRAVRPGFALTAGNVDALASLCRRLDGRPLAIALAAIALRTRGLSELDVDLAGTMDGDPVFGVVDRVLASLCDQRPALALAVFRGGARVDMLRATMVDAGLPVDRLHAAIAELVAAGLCAVADRSGHARVAFSHTAVWEVAARRLDASASAEALRAAHARQVRRLVCSTDAGGQADVADIVDPADVRAAIRWTTAHHGWDAMTMRAFRDHLLRHATAADAARLLPARPREVRPAQSDPG